MLSTEHNSVPKVIRGKCSRRKANTSSSYSVVSVASRIAYSMYSSKCKQNHFRRHAGDLKMVSYLLYAKGAIYLFIRKISMLRLCRKKTAPKTVTVSNRFSLVQLYFVRLNVLQIANGKRNRTDCCRFGTEPTKVKTILCPKYSDEFIQIKFFEHVTITGTPSPASNFPSLCNCLQFNRREHFLIDTSINHLFPSDFPGHTMVPFYEKRSKYPNYFSPEKCFLIKIANCLCCALRVHKLYILPPMSKGKMY